MAVSSRKHNAMVWRTSLCLSVCPVSILTVTHGGQGAYDMASIHFSPTIRRTNILVIRKVSVVVTMAITINSFSLSLPA